MSLATSSSSGIHELKCDSQTSGSCFFFYESFKRTFNFTSPSLNELTESVRAVAESKSDSLNELLVIKL